MALRWLIAFSLTLLFGFGLVACGTTDPAGPSSAEGITLMGTVVGGSASSASARATAAGSSESIVVTVQGTSSTTTVGSDGTFVLRGLPQGSFTLVFTTGGTTLGTLTFNEVAPNQEITITVSVVGSTVVVVEEKRNGIGHGDVEIEGLIEAVLLIDPAADSRLVVRGSTIVVRPGTTAIREGNKPRTLADLLVGTRVHVKGTFLPPEAAGQPVLASEVKLQGGGSGPGPTPSPTAKPTCAAGSRAEVEGLITFVGASSVTVAQQGKGDFLCLANAGTKIRKGNTTLTLAQLAPGSRVHVKGTAQGLLGATCQVSAEEIKLQN